VSQIEFAKYQALGNDFLIVDSRSQPELADDASLAIELLDRHFGAGADDLIFVLASKVADLRMRIRTPGGGWLSFCGNGIRCLGRFVRDWRMSDANPLRIETDAGIRELRLQADGIVEADLLEPDLRARSIPTTLALPDKTVIDHPLDLGELGTINVSCVSVGNPHAVFFVNNLDSLNLARLGPAIERHPAFTEGVNVHAIQVLSPDSAQIRTWERGAGLTLA
jgi:diaminopimelate epimerase